MSSLRVVTYNIRKGKGASGRRPYHVEELAHALRAQRADLVLCQEVFHAHHGTKSQSHEIGKVLGMTAHYLPNMRRRVGHHGNATFSRWPVEHVENFNMTIGKVEKRGALYVRMNVRGRRVHVVNVHLSLRHGHRVHQVRRLHRILRHVVPAHEPLVIAGDFNDWRRHLDSVVVGEMGMHNAFHGTEVRTWPAPRPVFNLDRVYVRNLQAAKTKLLHGGDWKELSDHLPLRTDLSA